MPSERCRVARGLFPDDSKQSVPTITKWSQCECQNAGALVLRMSLTTFKDTEIFTNECVSGIACLVGGLTEYDNVWDESFMKLV